MTLVLSFVLVVSTLVLPAQPTTTPPSTTPPVAPEAECDTHASWTGGVATGESCVDLSRPGYTTPSITAEQAWNQLCRRSGFGNYDAANPEAFSVNTEPLGKATGTVNELVYTENLRTKDPGALNILDYNTFTVPTTGTYTTYRITCTYDGRTTTIVRVFFDNTTISPIDLRNRALAQLTIPQPQLGGSPPLTERFSVVNIPTWFWIDNWPQTELTATDTNAGLTVSVTATPTNTTWDPGDGNRPINCPDGGTPWTPGLRENATTCSHTYTRSTAGQPNDALTIEASITWDLTWTINNTPQGTFATYTNTTQLTHQVGEIHVINVTNRPNP